MPDPTMERIALDPGTAIALRNWLVTLSQRLGLDSEAAAEAPTPPTTTPSDEIAPLLGKLAVTLDVSMASAPDTVTINVRAMPAPERDYPPVPVRQRQALDDRVASPDNHALDQAYGESPALGDMDDREAAYYFNPEQDPPDDTFERYVLLPDAIWRATPTQNIMPSSADNVYEQG